MGVGSGTWRAPCCGPSVQPDAVACFDALGFETLDVEAAVLQGQRGRDPTCVVALWVGGACHAWW